MFSGFITDILDAVSVPEGWKIVAVSCQEGDEFSYFSIEIKKERISPVYASGSGSINKNPYYDIASQETQRIQAQRIASGWTT